MQQSPEHINDNAAAPAWARKLAEAREAAWLSLTVQERQAAAASREERKERRRRDRDRRRAIHQLHLAGATPPEIIAATGVSEAMLRYRFAGLFSWRKGFRRLFSWLSDAHVAALDAIAADLGVERAEAHRRLLAAVLADDGFVARRQLGVRRRAAA